MKYVFYRICKLLGLLAILSVNFEKINGAVRVSSYRASSYRASSYRASSYQASSYRASYTSYSSYRASYYQSSVSSFRSSTRSYKTAAIISGTVFMSRRYRTRYYKNNNYDPVVCENYETPIDEEIIPLDDNGTLMYDNRTVYGLFVCPLDDMSDKVYCCGSEMQEYCCTFWEGGGRLAGVIIGILIFLVLLIVGFCFLYRYLKRKNHSGVVIAKFNGDAASSTVTIATPIHDSDNTFQTAFTPVQYNQSQPPYAVTPYPDPVLPPYSTIQSQNLASTYTEVPPYSAVQAAQIDPQKHVY